MSPNWAKLKREGKTNGGGWLELAVDAKALKTEQEKKGLEMGSLPNSNSLIMTR